MYLFIDTETAGLDPLRSPVLTIAGIITDKDFAIDTSFYYAIKPDLIRYPVVIEQAMMINGLSIAELSTYGYDIETTRESILSQMLFDKDNNTRDKVILVGWNVRFDRGFLKQVLEDEVFAHRRDIDLCGVYQFMYPGRKSYSLDSACEHFQIERNKEHNALEDAFITIEVAKILQKRLLLT